MTRNPRSVWPEPIDAPVDASNHGSTVVDNGFQHRARVIISVLSVAILLLTAAIAALMVYVKQDHDYVQGRGRYRDQEAAAAQAESKERVRVAVCDVLDGLPAGALLDPVRDEYNCGPGVPPDQLTPAQKSNIDQLNGASLATPDAQDEVPARPTAVPGDPWTYQNYDPCGQFKGWSTGSSEDKDPSMPGYQSCADGQEGK